MWWHEDSSNERVGEEVARVEAAWREGLLPTVVAVGSAWDEKGRRVLFIGVDARADPRPGAWAPGRGLVPSLTRLLIRRFGPLPYPGWSDGVPTALPRRGSLVAFVRAARELMGIRLAEPARTTDLTVVGFDGVDPVTRDQVGSLGVSPEAQFGYLGPLRLTSRSGTRLCRQVRDTATLGCVVDSAKGRFFSTAGHLGAAAGEPLYFLATRLWRRRRTAAGLVEAATSPSAPDSECAVAEGVDLAIVRPTAGSGTELSPVGLANAAAIQDREHLVWKGGVTGRREGWVASMLTEIRGRDVQHRNTIRVMASRRGAAKQGDSGTAVYTKGGDLVGHIVGVEGYRHRAMGQAALVQDARTSLAYFESRIGPVEGVFGDRGV